MGFEIKQLPEYHVAYVRHRGAYSKLLDTAQTLLTWAHHKSLVEDCIWIGLYWDDPEVIPEEELVSDACLVVAPGMKTSGEIKTQVIPQGKYAVYQCLISEKEWKMEWEMKWWYQLFSWVLENGYEMDSRPCYELYRDSGKSNAQGKLNVELCMPIR